MKVIVLDPAVDNVNAGDEIISNSVQSISKLGPNDVTRLTTHRMLRASERKLVSDADLVILSGTNALSSRMERFRQWFVDPDLALRMSNKLLLLGVGWWQYQQPPNMYTRALFRRILTDRLPHSTRDQYTSDRISSLGFGNLMTGCPTMWNLDDNCQRALGSNDRALITVTDYKRQDPEIDRRWIAVVKENYSRVEIVGMGPGDENHFNQLGISGVEWRGQGVDALEAALPGADFIGTRLHAGVRALQRGRPAAILAVDNRAVEISRSTGLNVVDRADTLGIHRAIRSGDAPPPLTLNKAAVDQWLQEFEKAVG